MMRWWTVLSSKRFMWSNKWSDPFTYSGVRDLSSLFPLRCNDCFVCSFVLPHRVWRRDTLKCFNGFLDLSRRYPGDGFDFPRRKLKTRFSDFRLAIWYDSKTSQCGPVNDFHEDYYSLFESRVEQRPHSFFWWKLFHFSRSLKFSNCSLNYGYTP